MTISEKQKNARKKIKYFFSDKESVFVANKITMPDKHVTFTLKNSDLTELHKGVATLNLPDIAVIGDGKSINLVPLIKKIRLQMKYLYQSQIQMLSLLLTLNQKTLK